MSDEKEIIVSKVILIPTGWIINIIVQLLWRYSSYEDNVLDDGLLVEGRSVAMEKAFIIYSYYSISTMITWGTFLFVGHLIGDNNNLWKFEHFKAWLMW